MTMTTDPRHLGTCPTCGELLAIGTAPQAPLPKTGDVAVCTNCLSALLIGEYDMLIAIPDEHLSPCKRAQVASVRLVLAKGWN